MHLALVEKGELFLGYHLGEKGLNTKRNCFGDDFVNSIAEGNGPIVVKRGGVVRFRDKGQEGRIESLQNFARSSTFFYGLEEIFSN